MTSRLPVPRFPRVEEVGFNRRAFLWRTGTLGAAATIALYPQIAKAAGVLDPILDQIAKPAMDVLARDTIAGLVAFEVPGTDRYSQAQGVTSSCRFQRPMRMLSPRPSPRRYPTCRSRSMSSACSVSSGRGSPPRWMMR
jgi:hypothetical protein